MPAGDSKNEPHREKKPSFIFQCGHAITRKQDIKHINVGVDVEEVYLVKSRVMFLGYYMFLLSETIKEEILPTHTPRIPTENIPIPSQSDIIPCSQVPHPHNFTTGQTFDFFP